MASFRDSDLLKLICKPDPVLLEDQSSETSSERHNKTVVLLTFFYKISCRDQVDKARNNERKEDLFFTNGNTQTYHQFQSNLTQC